jgi:hypothetical protein
LAYGGGLTERARRVRRRSRNWAHSLRVVLEGIHLTKLRVCSAADGERSCRAPGQRVLPADINPVWVLVFRFDDIFDGSVEIAKRILDLLSCLLIQLLDPVQLHRISLARRRPSSLLPQRHAQLLGHCHS